MGARARGGDRRDLARRAHTSPAGGADAQRPGRDLHAQEWAESRRARGPFRAIGRGQRVVPRRVGPRGAGSQRLRPSVRARHVPGLRARGRRPALRGRPGGGRRGQRQHQCRSHQLLRDGAVQLPRDRAVARIGSHGLPPQRARPEEARHPARRGEERARGSVTRTRRTAWRSSALASCSTPPTIRTTGRPSATWTT